MQQTTTTTPAVPDVARARPGPAIVKRLLPRIGRTPALDFWKRSWLDLHAIERVIFGA
jgi:hypothetical protein